MVRGESKFEKCTLSVKLTFRGWGSNSIDALSGIHVSLISKSILILTEILTLRGQGVGGSEDNVSLTLSVHFSNFDSPLKHPVALIDKAMLVVVDWFSSTLAYSFREAPRTMRNNDDNNVALS